MFCADEKLRVVWRELRKTFGHAGLHIHGYSVDVPYFGRQGDQVHWTVTIQKLPQDRIRSEMRKDKGS